MFCQRGAHINLGKILFLPPNAFESSVGRKFLPFSHFCSHYHVIANGMSAKGVFRNHVHVIASWGPADQFHWQYCVMMIDEIINRK